MSRRSLVYWTILLGAAISTLASGKSSADEIRYLAWDESAQRAVIETAAGAQVVELGDLVPGYGSVISIDREVIVLRRVLSEAERDALYEQGRTDYWAEQVDVVREDLLFHGVATPPGP